MSKTSTHCVAATFAVVGLFSLGACSTSGDARLTAERGVYAASAGLNTALAGAVTYAQLPRCPAKPACSDPATIAKIQAAEHAAAQSLDAAERVVRDPNTSASQATAAAASVGAAVTSLAAIVQTLPTIQGTTP